MSKETTFSVGARVAIVLAATAALWIGVATIGMNADDYQFIEAIAPIRSFHDALRVFAIPDANPSYFRPLAAFATSIDFLLFGWWGGGYHLTNLFFHLVATLCVFFVSRNVFRFTANESLAVMLVFGLLASHETNLTVDMMRPDAMCTVFILLSLLLGRTTHEPLWRKALSVFSFALALLSKELAIVLLMLLPVVWIRTKSSERIFLRLFPYLVVSIAFYCYHAHFTSSTSELLAAPSVKTVLRNIAYSIGYTILPFDLSTSHAFVSFGTWVIVLAIIVSIAAIIMLYRNLDTASRSAIISPILFTVIAGALLCLDFQRWRVYLPSVSLAAIAVLCVSRSNGRQRQIMSVLLAIVLGFHVYRAIDAQAEFREGTAILSSIRQDLEKAVRDMGSNTRVGVLALPAKLGGAGVWQVGRDALIRRAEANVRSERNWEDGSTRDCRITSWCAIEIYSLDPSEGFHGVSTTRIANNTYLIAVPEASHALLIPMMRDRSWREFAMHVGDSITTTEYRAVVRSAVNGAAKSIELHVTDTSAAIYTFRDDHLQSVR